MKCLFETRIICIWAFLVVSGAGCAVMSPKTDADAEKQTARAPASEFSSPQNLEGENSKKISPEKIQTDSIRGEATAEYHFSLAQAYMTEGNLDRAIEEYKVALSFDPKSALIYTRLAGEYIKKGLLTEAFEACKQALVADPRYMDARVMLAGLYGATRDVGGAVAEYDKILNQDKGNEEALVYRSQLLLESGETDRAQSKILEFIKKNPDSHVAWYYKGRVEQKNEKLNAAEISYQKALSLKSSFYQAALSLGFLYEGSSRDDEAVKVYQRIYDETQDSTAAGRLSTILLKKEKYKEALPYLEGQALSDPEDLNTRVKLGLVQMELKQNEKAVATFKEILIQNPDSDRILYYLGNIYEDTKEINEALAQFQKIHSDSKLYADAISHIALLQKQNGNMSQAKSTVEEALKKSPKEAKLYLFSASLEDESKNFTQAITTLEKANTIFPEDEKIKYYLGSLYDRAGDTDKSVSTMEAILVMNPNHVDALNYVGYTWTIKGIRMNDAEKLIKKAMKLKPENGYIQDSWGWHLFLKGKTQEAIVALEKASKMKPNEPTILEHLGDAYMRAHLIEKAFYRYQEASQHSDEGESKQKLVTKIETVRDELSKNGRIQSVRKPASESTE